MEAAVDAMGFLLSICYLLLLWIDVSFIYGVYFSYMEIELLPSFGRFVFGAGITLWIWLRKMRQKGVVRHVVLLITRKRLLAQPQVVKGN